MAGPGSKRSAGSDSFHGRGRSEEDQTVQSETNPSQEKRGQKV